MVPGHALHRKHALHHKLFFGPAQKLFLAIHYIKWIIRPYAKGVLGHTLWGCLERRLTRHTLPNLWRSKRPPHLRRKKCSAPWRVRRHSKQPLYKMDHYQAMHNSSWAYIRTSNLTNPKIYHPKIHRCCSTLMCSFSPCWLTASS
jgi:hypothetical protein